MKNIFVMGAEQISIQEPLSEEWMENPISHDQPFTRAVSPDYRKYFKPLEARRYGELIKRAIVTSETVLRNSGMDSVDAIITGTGMGCVQDTEDFLMSLCVDGEQMSKPSSFMHSTHNTISSAIAIRTRSHGYNITYSHRGVSFDYSLLDAYLQFRQGAIRNALVGSHDECTPSYFKIIEKTSYAGEAMKDTCAEASVSLTLSSDRNSGMCMISGMDILYRPTPKKVSAALGEILKEVGIQKKDIAGVITGINGNPTNDQYYSQYEETLFKGMTLLHYKHIFGECYSASGLGFYVAAKCLERRFIPPFLVYRGPMASKTPRYILLFNHSDGKTYSLILLSSTCGN